MIPLHDDIPAQRVPVVNYLLIAANILVFVYELWLGPELGAFFRHAALYPVAITRELPFVERGDLRVSHLAPLLTSMFLHGGWLHVGGNMLFLWIFGDNVEDRLGHVGYLFFYLLAGLAAAVLEIAMAPTSGIPTVGASGAIAGVLGAYMVLYPDAQVLALVPLGFFITTARVSAWWFLLIWFLFQAVHGVASLAPSQAALGGVAWWAHIGGFGLGVLVGLLLRRRGPRFPPRQRYSDRWYSNR
jgi:membrane associated rhomboid family serine protease